MFDVWATAPYCARLRWICANGSTRFTRDYHHHQNDAKHQVQNTPDDQKVLTYVTLVLLRAFARKVVLNTELHPS